MEEFYERLLDKAKESSTSKAVIRKYEEYLKGAEKLNLYESTYKIGKYKSLRKEATADRKKGENRSHTAINKQILYWQENEVSRSVAGRRRRILKEKGVDISKENLMKLSHDEYNILLHQNKIDVTKLYKEQIKLEMKMNKKLTEEEANKNAARWISQNIYGSK